MAALAGSASAFAPAAKVGSTYGTDDVDISVAHTFWKTDGPAVETGYFRLIQTQS